MTIEEIRKNAPDEASHYYIFDEKVTYIQYFGRTEVSWIKCFGVWAMMDYPYDFDGVINPLYP